VLNAAALGVVWVLPIFVWVWRAQGDTASEEATLEEEQ
jgi:hypothetical protein